MNEFERIASEIHRAADIAKNTPNRPEAKLREPVAPLWKEYVKSKGIRLNFHLRDERTLANGRPDTVYNRLMVEYKKPGAVKPANAKDRFFF